MVILIIVAGRFCLGARLLTPVAPSAPMMSGPKKSKIGMGVVRFRFRCRISLLCLSLVTFDICHETQQTN